MIRLRSLRQDNLVCSRHSTPQYIVNLNLYVVLTAKNPKPETGYMIARHVYRMLQMDAHNRAHLE